MGKYTDLSDFDLMYRVRKYDSRALEELYDRYSALLYTLIKKIMPDDNSAEDVLIEVFAVIWRNIERFDFKTGNVYVWLVTLARNKAVDTLNRSRQSPDSLEDYSDKFEQKYLLPRLAKDIDVLDLETSKKLKPKIESALSKLTDAQKYVIHLAYYEGFTITDISKKLNIPVETVRNKVMLALKSLRDNLLAE